MAHPLKAEVAKSRSKRNAEGVKGHNAKLKRMTENYGAADPSMTKTAMGDLENGPGTVPSFGEGAEAPPAGDRARRSSAANPIATYKRGGTVKAQKRAFGGALGPPQGMPPQAMASLPPQAMAGQLPPEAMMGQVPGRAFGGGVIGRARGGRKQKGATHVNVIIGQPLPGNSAPPPGPVVPPTGLPALPGGPGGPPHPPMGAGPGPGGPMPPMPPGMPPPGMIPPRKRGGGVHSDEAEDRAMIKGMVKPSALKHRARGGTVLRGAGAESGEGRLNRNRSMPYPIEGEQRARGGSVLKGAGAESGEGRLNRNRSMGRGKLKGAE